MNPATTNRFRVEEDSLGDVPVPANHLQMRDTYECDGFHCDYLRR
jgi:hypothetical protein